MVASRDGQNFAPDFPESKPVVNPGEFIFCRMSF